jgi:hypothetical protein
MQLELQLGHFLVRVHDLVAYLHHELKSDVRFLYRNHDIVNILPVALY